MINLKVEKINVSKTFDRTKLYAPEDITEQVVMPIIDVERLDSTLDTSSLTLINDDKDAITPFTRFVITLENDERTWTKKTFEWKGFIGRPINDFYGENIWFDGDTYHFSWFTEQFFFNEATNKWESETWTGDLPTQYDIPLLYGNDVWKWGDRIFSSGQGGTFELNKEEKKWSAYTFKGATSGLLGRNIWTFKGRIIYSNGNTQLELNQETGEFEEAYWRGLEDTAGTLVGADVWSVAERVFYSNGMFTYEWVKNNTWQKVEWKESGTKFLDSVGLYGRDMWSDGARVFYSHGTTQEELDIQTMTFKDAKFKGLTSFYGEDIWNNRDEVIYTSNISMKLTPDERIYRLVESDTPELLTYGAKPKYRHTLNLIEPTKWLERFDVDNTTITNYLAFLYADEKIIYPQEASYTQSIQDATGAWVASVSYGTDRRFYDTVEQGTEINPHIELDVVYGHYSWGILVPIGTKNETAIFTTATVTSPDGEVSQLRGLSKDGSMYEWKVDTLKFGQLGKYKFTWTYRNGGFIYGTALSWQIQTKYTWEVNVVEAQTSSAKFPQRYSIAQVVNLVLQKAGDEATVLRDGIDAPLFKLDGAQTDKLSAITAPEFTFTQSTLFGILSQIGEAINAIPRLVPTVYSNGEAISASMKTTNTKMVSDYWTAWNTITFDFLGQQNAVVRGEVTASEQDMRADNFATAFVTNAQNAFQTNNFDYIALTEPYADGFVSTRTEDASFEISNNSACIKTSRPIQRIVEVMVYARYRVEGTTIENTRDITKYVKESADYSILKDYADNSGEVTALGTKEMAIYYTRGTNIIGGLTYTAPTYLLIGALSLSNAITNILRVETGSTSNFELKDLMFRVKYVPFYNLKLKQYKAYIDEHSGNNDLFYNQQNAQMIDIESLGENMKGALLRTANQEITRTEYFDNFAPIIHAGQLTADGYYAYQVNREITNKRVKTTTSFSKDFNKWNEYIAIKKNYREWEISEKESVETNPSYNEFCIISTTPDWEVDKPQRSDYQSDEVYENAIGAYNQRLTTYASYLAKLGGFSSDKAMEQIAGKLSNKNEKFKPIDWVVGTTKSEECVGGGTYQAVEHTFLLPCACFSFGNSVVMNFGALDNYAIGTYADIKTVNNNSYALENYVKYTDKYGRAQTLALCFGSGNAKIDGFTTYNNALTSSKEFYNFSKSELNENAIVLDYRDHPFIVNKDSRQALNFTIQLHFVTETERIWLGKGFAQMMSFVGNTQVGGLRFAEFHEKPDKFLSQTLPEPSSTTWTAQPMPNCKVNKDMKALVLSYGKIANDCVGVGIVDSQNRCVLFYDKEYKAGDEMDTLYFEFRRKI